MAASQPPETLLESLPLYKLADDHDDITVTIGTRSLTYKFDYVGFQPALCAAPAVVGMASSVCDALAAVNRPSRGVVISGQVHPASQ